MLRVKAKILFLKIIFYSQDLVLIKFRESKFQLPCVEIGTANCVI